MVFIKTIDSKTLTFELNPKTTTVHTLKLEIEHKLHKSLLHQRLILPPSRLLSDDDDSVSISQLGVGRNSTLILHIPFFGGIQAPIVPKSLLEFLNTKPPPNYVVGLGRGATGFTTWSDIGLARAAPNLPDPSATTIGGGAAGPSGAGRGRGKGVLRKRMRKVTRKRDMMKIRSLISLKVMMWDCLRRLSMLNSVADVSPDGQFLSSMGNIWCIDGEDREAELL